MKAMTTAVLTNYGMCNAMDRGMVIEAILLLHKSSGCSGEWNVP